MKYLLYKFFYFCFSKFIGIGWSIQADFYRVFYKGRIFIDKSFYGPTPEIVIDGAASRIHIDKNVSFRGKSHFLAFEGAQIQVGRGVFFNRNCSINAFSKITIGDDCLFGESVSIWDHNHLYADKFNLIRNQGYNKAAVSIGNNCWLATNVVILKGVTIGEGAVIAAGSVVNKNIPSFEIWGGTPARKLGTY